MRFLDEASNEKYFTSFLVFQRGRRGISFFQVMLTAGIDTLASFLLGFFQRGRGGTYSYANF